MQVFDVTETPFTSNFTHQETLTLLLFLRPKEEGSAVEIGNGTGPHSMWVRRGSGVA